MKAVSIAVALLTTQMSSLNTNREMLEAHMSCLCKQVAEG